MHALKPGWERLGEPGQPDAACSRTGVSIHTTIKPHHHNLNTHATTQHGHVHEYFEMHLHAGVSRATLKTRSAEEGAQEGAGEQPAAPVMEEATRLMLFRPCQFLAAETMDVLLRAKCAAVA
eukprot:scaffold42372_cov17-Tisochrysis_lutea.AAC.4